MPVFYQATIGQQAGGFASVDNSGLNTDNEIATFASYAPALPGRLRQLAAYFAGQGATANANLVAWDLNGNVIADSPSFVAPAGSGGTGGQVLNQAEVDPSSGFGDKADGTALVFGFFTVPNQNREWSVRAAGNFLHQSTSVVASLAPLAGCAPPYVCGDIQAYGLLVGVTGHKEYYLDGLAAWKKRRH